MSNGGFTLTGVSRAEAGDPLGVWAVEPEVMAFGAEAAPAVPTWRVELPDAPEAAQAQLATREQALALSRRDLARAERELAQFDPTEPVAFSAEDRLHDPRQTLHQRVRALQEPVAFAAGEPAQAMDSEAFRQWNAFVERVRELVSHYARIETTVGGRFVGRTEVGWTGDCDTTWAPEIAFSSMEAHREAVHLALASRIALTRIVSVVATGAAGLAVKASIPGGQVLLLPATWRFVRDVLKELRTSWPDIKNLI